MNSELLVYLNGDYLPLAQANVPVLDRGFIFGDGVYEVVPVYDRRPFRLADHLRRLQHSLDGIRLANPHSAEEWEQLMLPLIAQAPWEDQGIYIQVTRGPAPRDHPFPATIKPTVLIMAMPLPAPPAAVVEDGVAAITAADNRWLRCDIKATALLANVLLRQLAVDAGCTETILIREGFLTEGSTSSVFLVKHGVIIAPPQSNLVLPGITYDVVLELARGAGIPATVRPVAASELATADEVWLTSSTKEITPVTTLDGHPVGDGRPGPVFGQLHRAYQAFKHGVMRASESRG